MLNVGKKSTKSNVKIVHLLPINVCYAKTSYYMVRFGNGTYLFGVGIHSV